MIHGQTVFRRVGKYRFGISSSICLITISCDSDNLCRVNLFPSLSFFIIFKIIFLDGFWLRILRVRGIQLPNNLSA